MLTETPADTGTFYCWPRYDDGKPNYFSWNRDPYIAFLLAKGNMLLVKTDGVTKKHLTTDRARLWASKLGGFDNRVVMHHAEWKCRYWFSTIFELPAMREVDCASFLESKSGLSPEFLEAVLKPKRLHV